MTPGSAWKKPSASGLDKTDCPCHAPGMTPSTNPMLGAMLFVACFYVAGRAVMWLMAQDWWLASLVFVVAFLIDETHTGYRLLMAFELAFGLAVAMSAGVGGLYVAYLVRLTPC